MGGCLGTPSRKGGLEGVEENRLVRIIKNIQGLMLAGEIPLRFLEGTPSTCGGMGPITPPSSSGRSGGRSALIFLFR